MIMFDNFQIPRKTAIFVVTLLITFGLLLVLLETFNMSPPLLPGYPGDAFYPRLVIGFTVLWCIVILLRGWRDKSTEKGDDSRGDYFKLHVGEFLLVTATVLAYAILLKPLGFEIATFLFLTSLLYPRMRYSPVNSMLVSVGLSVTTILLLWIIFGLGLKVQLPLSFLPLYIY